MPVLGDLVAVYGAVLASLIDLRQWRRDRAPLAFSAELGAGAAPDSDALWVRVVNRGPLRVTLEAFGLGLGIDWRRVPDGILGAELTMTRPEIRSGILRLEVFAGVEGLIELDSIDDAIYGSAAVHMRTAEYES